MSRIVSIWLPSWPIARFFVSRSAAKTRASAPHGAPSAPDGVDPLRPFALALAGTGGPRVVACNRAARNAGIAVGDLVSSARSKAGELQTADADPAADDAALRALALWCVRFAPFASAWDEASGADGIFLDTTGCDHLYGGEAAMLARIDTGLRRLGLFPRLAVADTAGAAWAVARYGGAARGVPQQQVVPPGEQESVLRPLPMAALRLAGDARALMRRLGLRRVGDLLAQPRGPLTARFGAATLQRLDQALGTVKEPISPLAAPPVYRAQASFVEAISSADHVVEAAQRLLATLAPDLARDRVGARKVRVLLFRLDGAVVTVTLGLTRASRDPAHMTKLIALRLARLPEGLEADFGFEAMAVHVLATAPMADFQTVLGVGGTSLAEETGLAQLIDRLEQRLGTNAVQQLHPYASHVPERAVVPRPVTDVAPAWHAGTQCPRRPLLLLPHAELAEVVALVPEGPPLRFRWRGQVHQVTGSEGPERIAPEWWRTTEPAATEAERDYYVLETAAGQRFWLYRSGHYGAEPTPNWYVHGVFA